LSPFVQLYIVGPPEIITDLSIPPDMITSTSFVVQWSEPSSDPVCGPVQYIVTVATGGIMISNFTVNGTTYTVTGREHNTLYTIYLAAYNAAGIGDSATKDVITFNKSGKDYLYHIM